MNVTRIHVLSLAAKIGANALVVIAPVFFLSATQYGDYAVIVSAIWIGAAVIEFGTGLELSLAGGNRTKLNAALRYVRIRDLLLLAGAAPIALTNTELAVACATAVLTAHWTSTSGIMRGLGQHRPDLGISSVTLGATACSAAFVAYYLHQHSLSATAFNTTELVIVLAYLPRLLATLLLTWVNPEAQRGARRRAVFNAQGAYRPSLAFAGPAMLAVAASNLDVVIASAFLPSDAVGTIRVATYAFGLVSMLPDLISQSLQTQLAGRVVKGNELLAEIKARLQILDWKFYLAGISIIGASISASNQPISWALMGSVMLFGLAMFLRVAAYPYASFLTVRGFQSARFAISATCMVCYWLCIPIASYFVPPVAAVPLALLLASGTQYVVYRRRALLANGVLR